jgi:hypothetical protein
MALAELDTDALGKAAGQAAEKGKKEGKKKLGYLKRMALDKFDEQTGAVAELDEAEIARREDGLGPIMRDLKQAKAHCVQIKDTAAEAIKHFVPAADSMQELANVCPCEARVLVSQICGGISGLARIYVDAVVQEVAQPVIQEIAAIDMAREAKEEYYEQRQRHDRALAAYQVLQAKTETIAQGPKMDKHEEVVEAAKVRWEQTIGDYDTAEMSFKNLMHQALHHKGCTDLIVFKNMAKCKLAEDSGIIESFAPATAELEKSRVAVQAIAGTMLEKCQYLMDEANLAKAVVQIEGLDLTPLPLPADDEIVANPMEVYGGGGGGGSSSVAAADGGGAAVGAAAAADAPDFDSDSDEGGAELPAVPDSAPPPIPGAAAPPAAGAAGVVTVDYTISKGAKGFGFSTDDTGVVSRLTTLMMGAPVHATPPWLPRPVPRDPAATSGTDVAAHPPARSAAAACVAQVTGSGGPAAAAGVPAGSRIVKVAGMPVNSKASIIEQLRQLGAGATSVVFTVETTSPPTDAAAAMMAI